ncbi:MAG: sn-glycerol-1-phosphate dehydrogenase [Roseiflexaceae bacterium]|nr:sn-glycerol-1-phosphate dehydrogenase [Roseiflexaceae bacterium]
MDYERIDAALRQASDTRRVVIGVKTLDGVDATFADSFGERAAVVIADETTFAVAGQAVHEHLRAAGRTVFAPIIFPSAPALYADFENVLVLETQLRQHDATPVVVGSGTLNDLTKLAAYRAERQYMCIGTAASMDGYTAFGAAITKDGFKQTMTCPAPRALLADMEIVAQAPPQMHATGYGDLLGKITAGADWILADALEAEPIDDLAWSLVQDSLRDWTAQPDRVRVGDHQAVGHLFEGLIMSGVAMQISASSRPASGSEHRFSHLWEMEALGHNHPAIPHGFKVGIGTIAAAALYERVLTRYLDQLDIDALCAQWPSCDETERTVRAMHDLPLLAENAVAESLAKYISPQQLRTRLQMLQARWPQIRSKLQAQLMTANELRAKLQAVGCPTEPTAIGLDMDQVRASYARARTIRARYTVLDLVNETGILDACVEELFTPGGYWFEHAAVLV